MHHHVIIPAALLQQMRVGARLVRPAPPLPTSPAVAKGR